MAWRALFSALVLGTTLLLPLAVGRPAAALDEVLILSRYRSYTGANMLPRGRGHPGVDFAEVKALISQGELLVSGHRTYPAEMRTAIIHRLELPQGRFERRIRLPPGRYSAIHRSEFNGSLLITLQKSEASNG